MSENESVDWVKVHFGLNDSPRTLQEVAEIVGKKPISISLTKGRLRSGKSRDKGLLMLYRVLFNVDNAVIDFFLNDSNFGDDGFYLREFSDDKGVQKAIRHISTKFHKKIQKTLDKDIKKCYNMPIYKIERSKDDK